MLSSRQSLISEFKRI